MTTSNTGIRRSITDLQADYDSGNREPLEALMRAWRGVKALPADDPRSFFMLGGYHGEPFRGPGATNAQWWGGYCQHGTVLFPTWHRVYLYQLEKALQSIEGCADVMLPFWDECSDYSLNNGIPRALTDEHFELDGVLIENPLRSFIFPVAIVDNVDTGAGDVSYSKPAGYETKRYPLSGLVGTADAQAATAAHNAKFPNYEANVLTLNGNIVAWLNAAPVVVPQSDGSSRSFGMVQSKFVQSMDTPTYTLFSNTTSRKAWNDAHPNDLIVALEDPHNHIHLAVGGFDVPGYDASPIDGANGDMGENETAGLDPIFFFHHCFIDYAFWTWQRRNGATDAFDIDASDPGAVYVLGGNNQPPAGADPNAPITMETSLDPFTKPDGSPFTTNDCVNIETQLGYSYGQGSLDQYAVRAAATALESAAAPEGGRTLHVGGLDRGKISGSFLIAAYAQVEGERRLVGVESVLSRWHVAGCANCQNHLEESADFRVPMESADSNSVQVEVHTRAGLLGRGASDRSAGLVLEAAPAPVDLPFTVELR